MLSPAWRWTRSSRPSTKRVPSVSSVSRAGSPARASPASDYQRGAWSRTCTPGRRVRSLVDSHATVRSVRVGQVHLTSTLVPDQARWRRTYFALSHSKGAPRRAMARAPSLSHSQLCERWNVSSEFNARRRTCWAAPGLTRATSSRARTGSRSIQARLRWPSQGPSPTQGFPRITLHGLRHSFATIALNERRAPVGQVSPRLGHRDAAITRAIYQHAIPSPYATGREEAAVQGKWLAERHGNRTHPGREHRPADGFEDRAGHQTGSRSWPLALRCEPPYGRRRSVVKKPPAPDRRPSRPVSVSPDRTPLHIS
jgi:hypothetical protein